MAERVTDLIARIMIKLNILTEQSTHTIFVFCFVVVVFVVVIVLLGCCLLLLLIVASAFQQLMLFGIDPVLDGCWHRKTLAGDPLVLLRVNSTKL